MDASASMIGSTWHSLSNVSLCYNYSVYHFTKCICYLEGYFMVIRVVGYEEHGDKMG